MRTQCTMIWRRELSLHDAQHYASTRDTEFWHRAMRELRFSPADMDNTNNLRLVAARAQQLKENTHGCE